MTSAYDSSFACASIRGRCCKTTVSWGTSHWMKAGLEASQFIWHGHRETPSSSTRNSSARGSVPVMLGKRPSYKYEEGRSSFHVAGNANPSLRPSSPHLALQLAWRRRMVARPANHTLRCTRCGGRMLTSEDGLACLACGHQDYGHEFKPLSLTLADARRALRDDVKSDSPFRANDMEGWPVWHRWNAPHTRSVPQTRRWEGYGSIGAPEYSYSEHHHGPRSRDICF